MQKKNFTVYNIPKDDKIIRFKVYFDYKLKLKAYSKKRFDPFCRWDRITIPYKKIIQFKPQSVSLIFLNGHLKIKLFNILKKIMNILKWI